MGRGLSIWGVLALLPCLLVTANAAEIRGTVTSGAAKSKPPARYIVHGGEQAPEPAGVTLVAVALEALDSSRKPTPPDTPLVMAQENTAFVPNLLVVPVGGEVTFPNHDAIFHNVFSYSPPQSFDLGRYPQGQTRTVAFDEPGIVRVFCEIHSTMFATIVVVNTDRYQLLPVGSEFQFTGLPLGRYRLLAVDPAGHWTSRAVDVTGDGASVVSLHLE